MTLSKAAIVQAADLLPELVDVPEWGGEVGIRVMTGAERDSFTTECMARADGDVSGIRGRLLVLVLCDAVGARLFEDDEQDDLERKSASVLERLSGIAQRVNGLTDDEVQEIAGNSPAGQSGDSGSSLPRLSG